MTKAFTTLFVLVPLFVAAQDFPYNPSTQNPYGLLNPKAPKQTADFKELIGSSQCQSVARIDQNTWADTVQMIWDFKYIMNGYAVQDETFKFDDSFAGSIRQYSQDSARWFVHYYSTTGSPTPVLSAWEGNRDGDKIVLYREQAAPNGMEGFYKITFSDISDKGFNWLGEWVDRAESFSYPTWKIYCKKLK